MAPWVNEACARAAECSEKKEYRKYLDGYYKNAESKDSERVKRRTQRGCLTEKWKADDLTGKAVLVWGENGIGDEVLTISCLRDVLQHNDANIFWRCDPKLTVLFTRSFPKVAFVTREHSLPQTECTVYSWELIGRFRKELSGFPWLKYDDADSIRYLSPNMPLRDSLSAKYSDGSKKVVGIAWRSVRDGELIADKTCNIRSESGWAAFFDRFRDRVRFVSLQYGDTADDIAFAKWKYDVEIYQDQGVDIYNDVDAAAAQIAAMDYVISISTTAAHMAGAMGVCGYILLSSKPLGHWSAGNAICPWYPTLRPIRQAEAGNWSGVLMSAADQLSTSLDHCGC